MDEQQTSNELTIIYIFFYLHFEHHQVDRFPSSSVYNFVFITDDLLFTFPLTIYCHPHFVLSQLLSLCSVWPHPNMLLILIIVYFNLYSFLNHHLHLSFLVLPLSVFISICGSLIWLPIISQCACPRFIPAVLYILLLFASTAHRNVNGHCYEFTPYTWGISVWLLSTCQFPVPIDESDIFPTGHSCISMYLKLSSQVSCCSVRDNQGDCAYMVVICTGLGHSAMDVGNANNICVWLT